MKTCKDFAWMGDIECCAGCHYEAEDLGRPLITIKVDGEMVEVCCGFAYFFYPDGSWKNKSKTGQWTEEYFQG